MLDLYQRLKSALLKEHERELKELEDRFGAHENGNAPKPSFKKATRKKSKFAHGELKKTAHELIKEFSDEFTTTEFMQKLRKTNRPMWNRVRKVGNANGTLFGLYRDKELSRRSVPSETGRNKVTILWKRS